MEKNQIPYFSKNSSILCTVYLLPHSLCGDTALLYNIITNPYDDVANTFNNYFASIAEATKKSINYSHKHFSDYISNKSSSMHKQYFWNLLIVIKKK